MKHLFWASLIAVGLLLNSVAVAGEHEGPSLRNSRVNRAVALSGKKDFGTKTITGCLLNGSAAQEYLLLGSQDEQWTLKSNGPKLGDHLYGFVRITVVDGKNDGTPLSVVSIRSARPGCSAYGNWGLPFLIVSSRCDNVPC
jgi:hypothetical protein